VSGDASHLPASFSRFGEVTAGMDVVAAIDAAGTPQTDANSGAPTEVVTIQSVTIKET
ncbi:MAG: Cyclophilin type peptidyl-prolyl cis-trans isomerase/CLD, partial [Actinomycetota bacterium]|nr:Cyclophilin type peptidyl-prolyl cis-trans isomerase/CLD [Actinomycetota bacterium]